MKLQSFKRIFKTDYKAEFQDLVDGLAASLNYTIESIITAFNNNISLRDNISCSVKEILVTTNGSGIIQASQEVSINQNKVVDGVICMYAKNKNNSNTYPSSGVFISYTQNTNNTITINNVSGLGINQSFLLRLVIFYTA